MNIQAINRATQNVQFGESAKKNHSNLYEAIPLALLLVIGAPACDNYNEKAANIVTSQEDITYSPAELKMLVKAQDLVGPYYKVSYDKDKRILVLTGTTLDKNQRLKDGSYKYNMKNLKKALALEDGILSENNKELAIFTDSVRNGYVVNLTTAMENNDIFYGIGNDDNPNNAILMPKQKLFIPVDGIGKKQNDLQKLWNIFGVFKAVANQNDTNNNVK